MIPNLPQDPQGLIATPPDANANTAPTQEPLKLFQDEARWHEALRIEEEYGGDIGAGRDWGTQLGAFLQDPVEMESLVQLRDWMLKEFRLMLIEWDLGVMIDAVYPTARKLIIERFRQPSLPMQDRLRQLFEQVIAARTDDSEATVAVATAANRDVRRIMVQTLTEEDWQAMTQAATATLEQSLHHKRTQLSGDETANDAGSDC